MDNVSKDFHKVEMTSRNELRVSGVSDVHSFNEEGVLLETSLGILTVGGMNLRITKLSLDQGEVAIKGDIDTLMYNDDEGFSQKSKGLFSKLFK